MKKIMVFLCVVLLLSTGLFADNIFEDINFKVSIGAESFSAPVKMGECEIFRYDSFITIGDENDGFSYEDIYTLSLHDVNGLEKQNRVFVRFDMKGPLCGVYIKAGAMQIAETIFGDFKTRWQDELIYKEFEKEYHDIYRSEYLGKQISTTPYNNFFYGFGMNIYIINSEKIALNFNGDFSTFRNKNFRLNFIHNLESMEWNEETNYLDQITVIFDNIENKTLKLGTQLSIKGETFSPWINLGYVFYQTDLQGKYISRMTFDKNRPNEEIRNFYTKTNLINNFLISSGMFIKIAKNFEVEAFASLGAFNGAGLSWIILL